MPVWLFLVRISSEIKRKGERWDGGKGEQSQFLLGGWVRLVKGHWNLNHDRPFTGTVVEWIQASQDL